MFQFILKQWDKRAQKDDFYSFIPAIIMMFSGANPAQVARQWIGNNYSMSAPWIWDGEQGA